MESGDIHSYGKLSQKTTSAKKPTTSDMSLIVAPNQTNTNTKNSTGSKDVRTDIECMVREQDRFMPIANVIRIMRKNLPSHGKISDDAKETIQECVSEFISFITGEANDRCQREQRKTITAEDILWAMSKLGFDNYIEPLSVYLNKYREIEGDRVATTMSMSMPMPMPIRAGGLGDHHGNSGIKRSSSNVEYGGGYGLNGFHYHNHQNGFLFGGLGLGLGPGGSFGMMDGNLGTSSSRPRPRPRPRSGVTGDAVKGGRGVEQPRK